MEEDIMERKKISAILTDDFIEFLKDKGLYENLMSGKIQCSQCGTIISVDNIAMIYFDSEYKFSCDSNQCIEKVQEKLL